MNCCGRIPAAEDSQAIRRRRGWRRACSVLTPVASRSAGAGGDPYRPLPRAILRLGDGICGRHPCCTARWSNKRQRIPQRTDPSRQCQCSRKAREKLSTTGRKR